MTKKILFIITQSELGGAQRFLLNLTTSLNQNKYKIVVSAGPEGDDKNGLLYALEKKGINTKHLKYLRRAINPLFDFLGLLEVYKLIRKEKPDTIFLCSSKAGVVGSFTGRLAKVPKVIYRVGGWSFNDPMCWCKKAFYKFIEKSSAKWKDIIIFNSEYERKQANELNVKPREKLITVYNGIDTSELAFLDKEKAREAISNFSAYGRPAAGWQMTNKKLIGTIANLYPAKGLEYLIEASYKLQATSYKLNFIVIGEGQERKKLEKLIKKYKLENNFFLIGATSNAYKYLKAFDIFVLPSVKEGFPWAILEAMASEVPIISTKVGAIPEIKPGILVDPKKSKQLAIVIESLIKNPELKEKLVFNAKNKVEQEFSLQKMVDSIEKLL